jgi:diguanylate cyclase (GGDEF)-like protein/PAS domain S-box-containing protein
MKRFSLQSQQVILYLLALGLFSLCVLMVAAFRGRVSTQISNDVSDAGRLRSYALLIYISEKEPNQSGETRQLLDTMGKEIQRLLKSYPESSDELIASWRSFYSKAESHQLNPQNSQAMMDAANRFLSEIRQRAAEEARNGYLMLFYGALGLLLLLIRGFFLVRELHGIETRLRNSERRFAILAEASLDGIAISQDGIIEDTNTQFCKLLGYEQQDIIGHHLTDFARAEDVDRSKEVIQNHQEITYEVVCVRKDKSTFPVEITARTLEFPNRTMRLTVARDITQRKQLEKEWEEANKSLAISNERWRTLATIDSLTGAYTRRALHLTMIREIRRAGHSGLPFSVMILDIDGFKQYNDTFGHVTGDEVLRRTVEVLRSTLRDVDVVARYGGDEFVIILVDTGALEANAVTRRCYRAICEETGFKRDMTASMGVITCFVETDTTVNKEFCLGLVEDILVRVDRALYQSKLKEDQERITIADNLRVNRDFSPLRTSTPVATVDLSADDSVDELVDNVMA